MELDLHIVVRSLGVASSLRGFEKLKEVDIRLVLLGTISTVGIEISLRFVPSQIAVLACAI